MMSQTRIGNALQAAVSAIRMEMRLGVDALYPIFADEKRKADLTAESKKGMI